MVGLVLSVLTRLAPKITSPQDIKHLLLYLVRSCTLHQPCKPLIAAIDRGLVYSVAMKVNLLNFEHFYDKYSLVYQQTCRCFKSRPVLYNLK